MLVAWLALLPSPSLAGVAADPLVQPLFLDPPILSELPPRGVDGIAGSWPAREGEPFLLQPDSDRFRAETETELIGVLLEVLAAADLEAAAKGLVLTLVADDPTVDPAVLEREAAARETELAPIVAETLGSLSAETIDQVAATAKETAERLTTPQRRWRLEQWVDDGPILGAGLEVITEGGVVRGIEGALFAEREVVTERRIGDGDASELARQYVGEGEVRWSLAVMVPVAEGLRHAWQVRVEAPEGPYDLWVDADSKEVVQVLPAFSPVAASATGFAPGLSGTTALSFQVNPPVNGTYGALSNTLTAVHVNLGADGVAGPVTLADDRTGSANYDQAPFNVTTNVTNLTLPGYNSLFQHVNAMAWFDTVRTRLLERTATSPFPIFLVNVNDPDPCGFGLNNACASRGAVSFGLGTRTMGLPTGFDNAALDPTVVAHEVGHGLHRAQMGETATTPTLGVLNGSLDEGLADYWAMTLLNTRAFGVRWAGTTTAVQTGFIPRAADAADVFPEHLTFGGSANNEIHANGQVIAFAMMSAKDELAKRNVLGPFALDVHLMQALHPIGLGQSNGQMPSQIHAAYRRLLLGLAGRAGNSLDAQDILVGFARAGLTISPNEAIVSIDRDVISQSSVTPPVLTVWGGEDYAFDASGLV